jgi:hypothetical protein
MDPITVANLIEGTNTLRFVRDASTGDDFVIGTVTIHWKEPVEWSPLSEYKRTMLSHDWSPILLATNPHETAIVVVSSVGFSPRFRRPAASGPDRDSSFYIESHSIVR